MTRQNYINHCKYYKGEKRCPWGGDGSISDKTYRENNKAYWWNVERMLYGQFSGDMAPALAVKCYIMKGIEGGIYGEKAYLDSYSKGEFVGTER